MDHRDYRIYINTAIDCLSVSLVNRGYADKAIQLNRTPRSLGVADDLLTLLPRTPTTKILVGAYFAGVLQKNHDGYWSDRDFVMETGKLDPWEAVDRRRADCISLVRSYEIATGQRPPSPLRECA